MPLTAPDTRSLSYSRPERNTHRPERARINARCASRIACLTDRKLSGDARLVYPLLDDYAGRKGVGWPKQQTLAHRLGLTLRRVQSAIAELAAVGWIAIVRTGRANRYSLRWAMADQIKQQCADRNSVYQPEVIETNDKTTVPSSSQVRNVVPAERQAHPATADSSIVGESNPVSHSGRRQPASAGGNMLARGIPGVDPEVGRENLNVCPRCQGSGEREYSIAPGRTYLGKPTPGRRWRGICGCRL